MSGPIRRLVNPIALALLGIGCVGGPPPPSQFPTARDAIDRMRDTYACSRGIVGEAKLDYFGDEGRIRANMLFAAARPERVRIDVYSPFGATLSTFTTDGERFALSDLKAKSLFHGAAQQCAVARFLGIPVPPHALVQLFAGEAPILVHPPGEARIEWNGGAYSVSIAGHNQARETIRLLPSPADWNKPWREQRLRVLQVAVEQEGIELYQADFFDHQVATTAPPSVDPVGLDPDIPPSGPECRAEIPRRMRFVVPPRGRDVEVVHEEVEHNPPLRPGMFVQPRAGGLHSAYVQCSDDPWGVR